MFKKLLPREDDFFAFFEMHAAVIVQGALGLLSSSSPEEMSEYIKSCESRADDITHQCIEALHKNFITPIERSDIHRLISTMDDVIDEINDVARFILLYKLKALEKEALALAQIIVQASKEIQAAVGELRKKKNTQVIQNHFLKINTLEGEADILFVQGVARLFEEEEDVRMIIKGKEIYEHLEAAINACDDVGNILEGIILEHE